MDTSHTCIGNTSALGAHLAAVPPSPPGGCISLQVICHGIAELARHTPIAQSPASWPLESTRTHKMPPYRQQHTRPISLLDVEAWSLPSATVNCWRCRSVLTNIDLALRIFIHTHLQILQQKKSLVRGMTYTRYHYRITEEDATTEL